SEGAGGEGTSGAGDREEDDEDGDDDDDSEVSNDELRAADRAHAAAWTSSREGAEDAAESGGEHGEAWLLEQNAWLMEELEAKDELIEALREQLKDIQTQQRRGQGPRPVSSMQSPGGFDLPADSDDSDDSD
ncbi:unnamed protein product, partial [Pylaiella littoralis]